MVIESGEWQNAKSLIELIKQYGKRLTEAKPLGSFFAFLSIALVVFHAARCVFPRFSMLSEVQPLLPPSRDALSLTFAFLHIVVELSIVNTIRRVLYIIRDEHKREQSQLEDYSPSSSASLSPPPPQSSSSSSLSSSTSVSAADRIAMLGSAGSPALKKSDSVVLRQSTALNESGIIKFVLPSGGDLSHSSKNLQKSILGTIHEFLEELKEVGNSIATQSLEHLHAKEIVMTYGKSRTVEQFLKFAAQKRTFEVVVVEAGPGGQGQEMAVSLASSGLETCLITDSAVFAIMARVNKVIVGTHAVMANGGLISQSGTHMIAQAAKHFNVPFVVCTGLYKLSPLYAHDQDSFNELKAPSEVLSCENAQKYDVAVKNPAWDYTPPELVSLYITNSGAYSPTYIYRLLAEYYHPEDMDL